MLSEVPREAEHLLCHAGSGRAWLESEAGLGAQRGHGLQGICDSGPGIGLLLSCRASYSSCGDVCSSFKICMDSVVHSPGRLSCCRWDKVFKRRGRFLWVDAYGPLRAQKYRECYQCQLPPNWSPNELHTCGRNIVHTMTCTHDGCVDHLETCGALVSYGRGF